MRNITQMYFFLDVSLETSFKSETSFKKKERVQQYKTPAPPPGLMDGSVLNKELFCESWLGIVVIIVICIMTMMTI